MNAKEMFEELGYNCIKDKDGIYYCKSQYQITISLENKEYWTVDGTSFTIEEHQAIHQQMIELGWINNED